ncbi:MAG: DUF7427 family protein [Mycobacterium sp.]
MRAGDRAWLTLAAGIIVYELSAEDGELLSESADRAMLRHPWIVRGAAFLLAAHVSNTIKPSCDPIHRLFALKPRR